MIAMWSASVHDLSNADDFLYDNPAPLRQPQLAAAYGLLYGRNVNGLPLGDDEPRLFSTHVIWPSFAINTIFYAAMVWMLFAAPCMIRRRRRIKRGLCPACAYPVGANDVCTECGRTVKRS